jgi:hypothetical protein
MSNVIPLRPAGKELNLTQMIDRLHALCEKLQSVKSEAVHFDNQLQRGAYMANQCLLARNATQEAIVAMSSAIDSIAEALAELIVDAAAQLIVQTQPAVSEPGQEDGRALWRGRFRPDPSD